MPLIEPSLEDTQRNEQKMFFKLIAVLNRFTFDKPSDDLVEEALDMLQCLQNMTDQPALRQRCMAVLAQFRTKIAS